MDLTRLFAELEGRLEAQIREESREEIGEFAEAELTSITLAARLRAQVDQTITVQSSAGETLTGIVRDVRAQALVLSTLRGDSIVHIEACASITPLGRAVPHSSQVESRLTFRHVLRQIARERMRVTVSAGQSFIVGYIVAVYRDHIDVRADTGVISVAICHIFAVTQTGI
ncbi:MAG: hypothetical protein Q4P05_07360 [Actinomycetaceae bacterium]|nr:hypothetical protein [Actinomycetaceae bacterium]